MKLKKKPAPPVSDINVTLHNGLDVPVLVVLIIFMGHHAHAEQRRQYRVAQGRCNPIALPDADV